MNGRYPRTESSWRAPVPCPGSAAAPCTDPKTNPEEEAGEKPDTTQRRESEAATLGQAHIDANQHLNAAHRALVGICATVIDAHRAAEASIDRLARFVKLGTAEVARRHLHVVEERHAKDGVEDRRQRPLWAVVLLWPAIIVSATYDTLFIGDLLQRVIDVGADSPTYYLAYLPGFGIMIGLLVTGHLLAKAMIRHRSRSERRAVRGPRNPLRALRALWSGPSVPKVREPDDLPWSSWLVAVVFAVMFFGTLWILAYARAILASSDNTRLAAYEPHMAVLLMVLSVATVALKAVAYNPYATSEKRAKLGLRRARWAADRLLKRARADVGTHTRHWLRLQGGLAYSEANARRFVDEAEVRILRERSRHGGSDDPHLDLGIPLDQTIQVQTGRAEVDADAASPLLTDARPPIAWRIQLEVLDYARDVSRRYHPEKLEERVSAMTADLHHQYATGEDR